MWSLNCLSPITNLGELSWYWVCQYTRDRENGVLTISHKAFADKGVGTYGLGSGTWVPASTSLRLDQFDADEAQESWLFCEVVGSLM